MKKEIILILIFAIFFSLAFFVLWPSYTKVLSLKKEISVLKGEITEFEKYIENLEKNKKELEEKKNLFSKIESALPEKEDLPEILNYLQNTASASGLLLSDFSFSVEKREGTEEFPKPYQEIKINLSLLGDYPSLKNFVSKIEKSSRLFEIESIEFSVEKESGKITMRIKTKFLPK